MVTFIRVSPVWRESWVISVVVPDLEAIKCGCGKMGCVETVSSATGIIRMAKDAVERGDHTSLALVDKITAKEVFDAAKAGDEVAHAYCESCGLLPGQIHGYCSSCH